ncbi:MAG TPA: acyl-CoA thioesterase domain-containing protein, partial [Acidimicrobiales bacterium]
MSATASEPLYTLDGGRLAPSGHTRGPWDDAHQHGGPPAALVARAVEGEVGDGFTVTRLTLELLRPVPIAPLAVRARVTRPGRRVVGVDVEVAAGEQPVVRAQAQAVRRADLPVGADRRPDDDGGDGGDGRAGDGVGMPGREAGVVLPFVADLVRGDDLPAFHRTGMEVLTVAGGFDRPGPARAWFRLRRPVVGGEEPTGL